MCIRDRSTTSETGLNGLASLNIQEIDIFSEDVVERFANQGNRRIGPGFLNYKLLGLDTNVLPIVN